jgi:N-acyl homoserine lactone hydrolase
MHLSEISVMEVKKVKLYIMHGGFIRNPDKGGLTPGLDEGTPIVIPVMMYLIDHPQGLVLVDTGMQVSHWPEFMQPDADDVPEYYVDSQLKKLGYTPEDLEYVILSHYHGDHCGGMSRIPNAKFIARREEVKEAWRPEAYAPGAGFYMFPDYKDSINCRFIEVEDGTDFDVFGDGSVICIDTKGHTRGHQSVLVNLKETGPVLLACDAVSLRENLDCNIAPGKNIWDAKCGLQALAKIRKMEQDGVFIITGHDPNQWKELRRAPEYYE